MIIELISGSRPSNNFFLDRRPPRLLAELYRLGATCIHEGRASQSQLIQPKRYLYTLPAIMRPAFYLFI